jgi:hypothetical protein
VAKEALAQGDGISTRKWPDSALQNWSTPSMTTTFKIVQSESKLPKAKLDFLLAECRGPKGTIRGRCHKALCGAFESHVKLKQVARDSNLKQTFLQKLVGMLLSTSIQKRVKQAVRCLTNSKPLSRQRSYLCQTWALFEQTLQINVGTISQVLRTMQLSFLQPLFRSTCQWISLATDDSLTTHSRFIRSGVLRDSFESIKHRLTN